MRRWAATWATAWFGSATTVEDRLFRWLAVLRVVVLVDAVVIDLRQLGDVRHPGGLVVCVVAMVAWTGVTAWAYAEGSRRRAALLGADLALAVLLVALTPLVKGTDFFATVPGFWVVGATLAWAVRYRWAGGLLAGAVVAAADLSVRTRLDQVNTGNLFLLLISGPIIGFMVESLVRMAAARDRAQREAAAAAERTRLARVVHDGVLQVLALTQRRGAEPGGDAELGRLAGDQEAQLRLLIREQDAVASHDDAQASLDLVAQLLPLGVRPGVEVVTPGGAVPLPHGVATELVAAATACVDNAARHAPGAQVWVSVEDLGDQVSVSVRDDGPGIEPDRLAQAAADGRLGVSESIRGRLADLGGSATLGTGPDGTEWELVVDRDPRSAMMTLVEPIVVNADGTALLDAWLAEDAVGRR